MTILKILGAFALFLALQLETVKTSPILPATEPGLFQPEEHNGQAGKGSHSKLVRGYLIDLFECWKSARGGTAGERRSCLAATGSEQPSSDIAKAESITVIPSKGEPVRHICTVLHVHSIDL